MFYSLMIVLLGKVDCNAVINALIVKSKAGNVPWTQHCPVMGAHCSPVPVAGEQASVRRRTDRSVHGREFTSVFVMFKTGNNPKRVWRTLIEKMLTDTIVEEEFELKEEEPWYDKQDLEHGTNSSWSLSLKPLIKGTILMLNLNVK